MVLRNAFSLLSLFTLCSAVTDRNGCIEIPAVSGRAMVDMTCPFVEVPPSEMLEGITWVHNTTSTILDMNDPRYIQTGNEFRILNIVPEDEGVYSCIFEIAGEVVDRSVSLVSTCIIVEAQAIFQACEMMSCNTGLLNSIEGGSVTIDSRVGFINGGACRINQSITLMVLRKEGGSPIYTCSNEGVQNIGRDCTSNERVQVTPPGEHKYDFNLTLTNVTNDDRGNYFLHVEFVNDLGSRSCLYQNFTLSISNTSIVPPDPDQTSNTPSPTSTPTSTSSPTQSSLNRAVAIGVAVPLVLVLVLILMGVAALLAIPWYRSTRRHQQSFSVKTSTQMVHVHEQVLQDSKELKRSSTVLETTETYFTEVFEADKCDYNSI